MKLYYHKTSGGAEYLFDTYIECNNRHREGTITDKTKYSVRIDGDITKDAELNIKNDTELLEALKQLQKWAGRFVPEYDKEKYLAVKEFVTKIIAKAEGSKI